MPELLFKHVAQTARTVLTGMGGLMPVGSIDVCIPDTRRLACVYAFRAWHMSSFDRVLAVCVYDYYFVFYFFRPICLDPSVIVGARTNNQYVGYPLLRLL